MDRSLIKCQHIRSEKKYINLKRESKTREESKIKNGNFDIAFAFIAFALIVIVIFGMGASGGNDDIDGFL